MFDYLQKYLPEFDEDATRQQLEPFGKQDLLEMLIRAYKEKRLILKMLAERDSKLSDIRASLDQPSALLAMPDVPSTDDLRRMMDDTASEED